MTRCGKPGYTPMLYEIISTWRPYVDGRRTLPEAATSLIEALRSQGNFDFPIR